mmetsp:Transcript_2440/g.2086  ORF Transcript_2440/g.2086 Transcript_2440/m.2086 type:complete len:121 (+) Transcript_2440:26-388(+)
MSKLRHIRGQKHMGKFESIELQEALNDVILPVPDEQSKKGTQKSTISLDAPNPLYFTIAKKEEKPKLEKPGKFIMKPLKTPESGQFVKALLGLPPKIQFKIITMIGLKAFIRLFRSSKAL